MKNELKIEFGTVGYIYFPTNQTTAKGAFDEFLDICNRVQINADNMPYPTELFLRNGNFEDIDHVTL